MYKSIIISYLLPKSSLMIYRLLVSIVTGETRRLVIYCFIQTRLFIYLKLLSLFLLKNQFSLKNKNKTKICFSLGRRGSQDGAISPSRYHSPLIDPLRYILVLNLPMELTKSKSSRSNADSTTKEAKGISVMIWILVIMFIRTIAS